MGDEPLINLIHLALILILDLFEMVNLLLVIFFHFLSLLNCCFGTTLSDLMVAEDGATHLTFLST